jgi:hypothetical protein
VRVHAGAFGDAQPHRDLLLSPDHAILCDGVLVPVRCLVNGATVVREPAGPVTYWHVELDRHDIVVAEGLACESFLDTGNRGAFENGGAVAQLHPDFALGVWQRQGCAPLCRDGAEVTAARRHLLARALALGHALTGDPALRLVADGKALPPPQIDGARHRFAVRRRARGVRLLSRSGVPSDVDPAAIDARRLGVRVERIAVFAPWRWHDLPLPAIPDGSGWHALEAGSGRRWRWTDGDACLPIPREVAGCGILLIDVHIGAAQPSWLKRRPTSHRRNTP